MLKFNVLHAYWLAAGERFAGGEHEVPKPSKELVKAAAAAHAAGAIDVSEGLDLSHVEPDEVSAEKLAEAMGEWIDPVLDPATGLVLEPGRWSGPWAEGHEINQQLVGAAVVEAAVDVEAGEEA